MKILAWAGTIPILTPSVSLFTLRAAKALDYTRTVFRAPSPKPRPIRLEAYMRYVRGILLLVVCLIISLAAAGQQLNKRLTNKDVVDLVSLGIADDIVIQKIQIAEATDFDTSIPGLKALKEAKVSDGIIRIMLNPHPAPTSAAPVVAPSTNDSGIPQEVGVYVVLKGTPTEMEPELVGWQTGGVMKSFATQGLTKGHTNGKVMKPKSAVQGTTPFEFIIKTPEGTSATEYQLLKLDEKDNRREFRAMTGGIIHASGGAEKNAVEFTPEKIAGRTWRIKLTNLKKGEYGFLPPGVSSQSISSSGKIYTFGVME